MCAGLALWAAAPVMATPIRPNVQKLLAQPPEPTAQFAPARAGWQGPEVTNANQPAPNSPLQVFGQEASARAVRASLLQAAIPEPWVLAAICGTILLLRRLRTEHERRRQREEARVPGEEEIELRPAA
jgi:hypothetical protein